MADFSFAKNHFCLPIGYIEEKTRKLKVVFSDPTEIDFIKATEEVIRMPMEICIGERSEIVEAIYYHYPCDQQLRGVYE